MRYQGKIAEWNDARGFGFIAPLNGGERVFVHISSFPDNRRRPSIGEIVNYSLGTDVVGRPHAEGVRYVLASRRSPPWGSSRHRTGDLIAWCFAVGFLAIVVMAAIVERLPWPLASVEVAMSVAAYFAYKRDKLAAQSRSWRTNEWTLILLGLIGGWPGALVAQRRFRHKTRKFVFQFGYWLSVAANVAVLVWLLSV